MDSESCKDKFGVDKYGAGGQTVSKLKIKPKEGWMKKLTLLLALALGAALAFAGSAHVLESGTPDLKVWVCAYKSQADLCVWVAEYRSQAKDKDGIWYFEKYKSNADFTLKIVKYRSQADLLVYYVPYRSQAGWRRSHPWTGRLR